MRWIGPVAASSQSNLGVNSCVEGVGCEGFCVTQDDPLT